MRGSVITYRCGVVLMSTLYVVACGTSNHPSNNGSGGSGGAAASGGSAATIGSGGTAGQAGGGAGGAGTGGQAGGGTGGEAGGGTGGAGTGGEAGGGTGGAGTGGEAGGGTGGGSGSGGAGSGGESGASGTGGPTIIAATPPMGWNSWNTFACDGLNEDVIKGVADIMVSSGMAAAGYQYVNLDDCWMDGRDASGNIQWNMSKFPNGSQIVDYVHGKGLKIGLYSTPNTSTCSAVFGTKSKTVVVGSLGHESQDAKTFASWGIDYLKYDQCMGPVSGFEVMRQALRASGRDIVYSINPGCFPPSTCSIDVKTIANLWRIGFDIGANWSSVVGMIDQNKDTSALAGPGHWNDPDMLEVGKGMSPDEDRAHFAMWAMMAAPLLAGNDIRSMSATTTAILTNPDIIAVDQDPLGVQGTVVATLGTDLEIWSKPLSGTNTRAVALLNRSGAAASMTVQWSTIGIPTGAATVRDLWNQSDLGSFTGSYTANSVPSHGVVVLKVVSAP
jgi:alpha-galactosidase